MDELLDEVALAAVRRFAAVTLIGAGGMGQIYYSSMNATVGARLLHRQGPQDRRDG